MAGTKDSKKQDPSKSQLEKKRISGRISGESASLGIWEWEIEGDRMILSPGLQEMTGGRFYSEFIPHTDYISAIHLDDQAYVQQLHESVSRAETAFTRSLYRLARGCLTPKHACPPEQLSSSDPLWVTVSEECWAWRDDVNHVRRVLGAVRLHESEPRGAGELPDFGLELLDSIIDGVVMLDADMNYLYLNVRAGELLGRDPADLTGKNYWDEYPEARGSPFARAYAHAVETGEVQRFESFYEPWGRWFENRIYTRTFVSK